MLTVAVISRGADQAVKYSYRGIARDITWVSFECLPWGVTVATDSDAVAGRVDGTGKDPPTTHKSSVSWGRRKVQYSAQFSVLAIDLTSNYY